jgi:acyl-CoA thioesterase
MAFADLAADTAVRRDPQVPNRYRIELADHWDYLLPSGGYVMTAALRAAEAEIADPLLRLASATTVFATPIRSGAAIADVQVIRRGKSTSQVRVALRNAVIAEAASRAVRSTAEGSGQVNEGAEGVELTATFVRDRHGPDVRALSPPAVRSVADAAAALDDTPGNPHARFRFYHQLESKIADGTRFWAGEAFEAGPGRYARWFRYRVPQRDAEGRLDRLALPPILDTMPTALHRAIGPGGYRFYAPSLDLTLYVVDDTVREWLLVAVELVRARVGWAVASAQIWDDEGRLVAHGSQAMYLHGLSGEPPVIDATGRR